MEKIIFLLEKKISDLDFGFPDGTEDHIYLQKLDQILDRLSEENFDLIFFSGWSGWSCI